GSGIAEERVRGGAPAPEVRFVHDVVVEQRRRMYELHDRGELVMVPATIVEGTRRQYDERGPQALAAAAHAVRGDLADQRNLRAEPGAVPLVHGPQVGRYEFTYCLQRHCRFLAGRKTMAPVAGAVRTCPAPFLKRGGSYQQPCFGSRRLLAR